VQIRKNEIAELGRLVRVEREAHLERDACERLGKAHLGRHAVGRIRAAHEDNRYRAAAHLFGRAKERIEAGDALERGVGLSGNDRRSDIAERLVERRCRGRDVRGVCVARTGEDHARPGRAKLARELVERLHGRPTRRGCCLCRPLTTQEAQDRELGTRPTGDPPVSIEPSERTARPDVDEAGRAGELGSGVGEIELLWYGRAPAIEEVGAERHDEASRRKIEPRPRRAVRAAIRIHCNMVGLEVDAEMRTHAERRQPAVEKRREASRLVLIDEERVTCLAPSAHLRELLSDEIDRFVPPDARPLVVALHHRTAEPVRIVEALHRRLTARAERAAIDRMGGIPFELDDVPVPSLGDHPACSRALTACGRVVIRDPRDRLVGGDEIRDELADFLGRASDRARRSAGDSEDFEEVAAFDAGARGRLVAHCEWFTS
jgi:hypothetical protein